MCNSLSRTQLCRLAREARAAKLNATAPCLSSAKEKSPKTLRTYVQRERMKKSQDKLLALIELCYRDTCAWYVAVSSI